MKKQKKYLVEHFPHLIKEWDFEMNKDIDINKVASGSHKKVHWICAVDHSHRWEASAKNRVNGTGCPFCTGRKIGYGNDLQTNYPELSKEWHPTLNGDLLPSAVAPKSSKKAFWMCSRNPEHVWEALISNRSNGAGCPKCYHRTSFPEQVIYFYFKKYFPDTINSKKFVIDGKKVELDVFIPSLNLGLEYDGVRFHKIKEKVDKNKTELLKRTQGLKIIRFREKGLSNSLFLDEETRCINNESDLSKYIKEILEDVGVINPDINVGNDRQLIFELYKFVDLKGNLEEMNPVLASEWHPTKNGALKPSMFTPGSTKRVWWRCSKGHEWEIEVNSRNRGNGCFECTGRKVTATNNFLLSNPELAKEWHPTKNGNLMPDMFVSGSTKRVWWLCNKDHEWEARIGSRTRGNGCPYCSNKKVGYGNDLQTLNPVLAKQWHPTKNGTLTPSMFVPGSRRPVWWRCLKKPEHEWEAVIYERTHGTGCPYCAHRKVGHGNDLQSENPELAAQWHPTKNGDLLPSEVAPLSGKKAFWVCSRNPEHEWVSVIGNRSNGTGCPHCRASRKTPQ